MTRKRVPEREGDIKGKKRAPAVRNDGAAVPDPGASPLSGMNENAIHNGAADEYSPFRLGLPPGQSRISHNKVTINVCRI